MKKTIRIHISGYIFNIEEDAYAILEDWLSKISNQYSDEKGGDEITNDIEMRVAEIFQEKIGIEEGVISTEEVFGIIEIMGKPEDFEEETGSAETDSKQSAKKTSKKAKHKKRLYRDEENSILGGVCSGIASYFGIDPLIIRIIFAATVIFGGFGTIIYIILWIIVPKAETTAQKLEMKGESVNISNIEKAIKDEFESVKKNFLNKTNVESFNKFKKGLTDIIDAFANIIVKLFKGVSGIIGVSFIIAGILAIIIAFSFFFSNSSTNILFFNHGIFNWQPLISLLPTPFSSTITSIGLFLLIAIPVIMIIYAGTRILFKYKTKGKAFRYTSLSLWTIGIIITIFAGIKLAENYQFENKHTNTFTLSENLSSTIYLKLDNKYNRVFNKPDYIVGNYNLVTGNDQVKLFGKPNFDIVKSKDNKTNLKLFYSATGRSRKDAYLRAQKISYLWNNENSVLNLQPYFTIKGENKLYKSDLFITLEIPVGKTIFIDTSIVNLLDGIENTENMWDHEMTDKKWVMTGNGLSLFIKNDSVIIEKEIIQQEIDTVKTDTNISI